MPATSVIVPARDAEATLGRTLEALARQDLEMPYEVVVVDDGSTDRTAQIAREARAGNVHVVEQSACGPAAARNAGVSKARAPLLAFCDADVFPTPGWLRAGIEALEKADLVQGRVLPDPCAELGPFDRTIWVTHEAGLYETASLFVRRETFDRVGGFEDWLKPASGKALAEDVWFGWKARRAGARTAFCEQALAHHAVFERDWAGYAGERARLLYFPAMAARMPELRTDFFYRRLFLNARTAAFDAGLAGCLAAALSRSPLPLVAALPYLRLARRRARSFGPLGRHVAAADLIADIVGASALARGSIRYRSPVL